MNKIEVLIAGSTNTGKTTVAMALVAALAEYGIPCIVHDDAPLVDPTTFHKRATALSGILEVEITILQTEDRHLTGHPPESLWKRLLRALTCQAAPVRPDGSFDQDVETFLPMAGAQPIVIRRRVYQGNARLAALRALEQSEPPEAPSLPKPVTMQEVATLIEATRKAYREVNGDWTVAKVNELSRATKETAKFVKAWMEDPAVDEMHKEAIRDAAIGLQQDFDAMRRAAARL